MLRKYPQAFRDRAVRMVMDRLEADEEGLSSYQVVRLTAPKLNVSVEALRRWVEQAEVDSGARSGVSSELAVVITVSEHNPTGISSSAKTR